MSKSYIARKSNPSPAKDADLWGLGINLSFDNELNTNHLKNMTICLVPSDKLY